MWRTAHTNGIATEQTGRMRFPRCRMDVWGSTVLARDPWRVAFVASKLCWVELHTARPYSHDVEEWGQASHGRKPHRHAGTRSLGRGRQAWGRTQSLNDRSAFAPSRCSLRPLILRTHARTVFRFPLGYMRCSTSQAPSGQGGGAAVGKCGSPSAARDGSLPAAYR